MTARLMTCLLLLIPWCSSAYSAVMVGHASIIDGEMLEIHGTRIRPWGSSTAAVRRRKRS
jgi:hypothetical protein